MFGFGTKDEIEAWSFCAALLTQGFIFLWFDSFFEKQTLRESSFHFYIFIFLYNYNYITLISLYYTITPYIHIAYSTTTH